MPVVFNGSTDIGETLKGSSSAGPGVETYRITGGGADMWGKSDAFHMDWLRLAGDVTLTAEVQFSPDTAALAKGVLIFRQSLNPDSAYADVAMHGDGHVTLQWRAAAGAETKDVTSPERHAIRLVIERKGDQFIASTQAADGTMSRFASTSVPLNGPVYVGLGVCAHAANGLVSVTFSHVGMAHFGHYLPIAH